MTWQRGDTRTGSGRPRSIVKWRADAARSRRRHRLFGWLAAASLLAHGWLPIVVQASLAGSHGGDRHARQAAHEPAVAAPDLRRSGHGQECPIFHDPICLCAIFVSFLVPAREPVPAPVVIRSARRRTPRPQLTRPRPVALFKARAPPRLR
jgi:hypothetical protein